MAEPLVILGLAAAHFAIGLLGSAIVIFASYVGLKGYKELPGKVYTPRLLTIYILIGGGLAVVLQSLTSEAYLPIQALTIGATWPSLILTYTVPKEAEKITDEQNSEADKFRALLT